ncbi:hypothetical protein FNU29_13435 [Escherichia albertii]|nr:hypothetical protein [Escherichia albertii]
MVQGLCWLRQWLLDPIQEDDFSVVLLYVDSGADYYEKRYRSRVLDVLKRRLKSIGYSLQQDPELCV